MKAGLDFLNCQIHSTVLVEVGLACIVSPMYVQCVWEDSKWCTVFDLAKSVMPLFDLAKMANNLSLAIVERVSGRDFSHVIACL